MAIRKRPVLSFADLAQDKRRLIILTEEGTRDLDTLLESAVRNGQPRPKPHELIASLLRLGVLYCRASRPADGKDGAT